MAKKNSPKDINSDIFKINVIRRMKILGRSTEENKIKWRLFWNTVEAVNTIHNREMYQLDLEIMKVYARQEGEDNPLGIGEAYIFWP